MLRFIKPLVRLQTFTNVLRHYHFQTPGAAAVTRKYVTTSAATTEEEQDKLYRQIEIEVRGNEPAVLRSYQWFALEAARLFNITVEKTYEPPKHFERRSLLKSIFIYKKHMVQYEIRTHFRIWTFKHLTGSTADTFLEYIQRNLPEGVAMKVTKHELQKLPEHIVEPGS